MKLLQNILIFFIILTTACNPHRESAQSVYPKPTNYIILLDLSDRLLVPKQGNRDIQIIENLYADFDRTVRQQLVVNSRDKFQVVIAPQNNISYNREESENELYIDMGTINASKKIHELNRFPASMVNTLQNLYDAASSGKTHADYQGSDIWKFFNETLPYIIDTAYKNQLVILTDGYFDLEDYTNQIPADSRFPTTSYLVSARGNPDWEKIIEDNDWGLIPIEQNYADFNLSVCVAEIHPKYEFQYEINMLKYTWDQWLKEMGIRKKTILPKMSLPHSKSLINEFFSK